jgi:LmbE family N-acetylglucosaminyl deacetylase
VIRARATGAVRSTLTIEAGLFEVLGIPPAEYLVAATAEGFTPVNRDITGVRSTSSFHLCISGVIQSGVLISRRRFMASATALPAFAQSSTKLKIVVAGGHPGDPECGCGGSIARFSALGHEVVLLYLNRGEGYCGAAPLDQCASIRTAEAREACRILGARSAFAGQIDGQALLDAGHYDAFARVLSAEKPNVVFTHWPIDHHRDHRAISLLSLDGWWKSSQAFALYFYEVTEDTTMFTPREYVDISDVESRRRAACYAHASQQPAKWYPKQAELTSRRGSECGRPQAEAFVRHPDSKAAPLPFVS